MAASRRDGIDPIHQYIYSYAAIFFIAKQALGETTAAIYLQTAEAACNFLLALKPFAVGFVWRRIACMVESDESPLLAQTHG